MQSLTQPTVEYLLTLGYSLPCVFYLPELMIIEQIGSFFSNIESYTVTSVTSKVFNLLCVNCICLHRHIKYMYTSK